MGEKSEIFFFQLADVWSKKNQKKHARKKVRQAERYWDERKSNGRCPLCMNNTEEPYLCVACGKTSIRCIAYMEDFVEILGVSG